MARNMVRKREIEFFVVCIGQSNVSKRYHGETHTHLQLWFSHHFFVFFLSFSLRKSARTCKISCCVWLLTVCKLLLTGAWGCTWTLPVAAVIVIQLLWNGNNSHNRSCDSYKTHSTKLLLFSLESKHVSNCVSCVVSRKKTEGSA